MARVRLREALPEELTVGHYAEPGDILRAADGAGYDCVVAFDLIGNERAESIIRAALASGSPPHAFLLAGPRGTGRGTAARRLAQALNCTGVDPPCGDCGQCHRIEAGIHSDVQTVSFPPALEATARKSISVEQVREVEQMATLTPYEGRTRVVSIDPADYLSDQAQNAFLKTLEEPPPNVVFALISEDSEALLETVRSRCTLVGFGLVGTAAIEAALIERGLEPERARLLARLSGGRPAWALAAAADAEILERRQQTLKSAGRLPDQTLAERMDLAERLSESFKRDRGPVLQTLLEWQGFWRDVLLVQAGAEEATVNSDLLEELRKAAEYPRAEVVRLARALMETRGYLSMNVQSRIALESLMLAVPTARPAGVK